MKSWIVYEHKSPSGKVYVGITCQRPQCRWKGGSGYVRGDNHQKIFANAIKKYGWDNFEHKVILEGISKSEADYAERYLIRWYKILGLSYNCTDGGDGGLGTKHTEETKKRLSEIHKGMKYPKEVTEKREKTKLENRSYYVLAVKPGIILQFNSNKEAAEMLGINNKSNISASISQKQCLVNGYLFLQWEKQLPIKEDCIYSWYDFRVCNRYNSVKKA